jgi:hypothetical protein
MIRTTTLVTFALAACLGAGLFKVKYAVQGEEQKLVSIQQQISDDQGAIHVLDAEWSAETQPQQLGEMAERHLALAPITAAQLGTFDTLPMRPAGQPSTPAPTPAAAPAAPVVAAMQPQEKHKEARTVVANASADPSIDAVLQAMQASAPQGGGGGRSVP